MLIANHSGSSPFLFRPVSFGGILHAVAFCVEILTQPPFLSVLVYTQTKLIQSTNTMSQEINGSCVHITHVYITPIIQ